MNYVCPNCKSCMVKKLINENYHKVLVRACKKDCPNNGELLEDYGYSKKAEIKILNKKT